MQNDPEVVKAGRIKDLMHEWAAMMADRQSTGFPSQVAFAVERVQDNNQSSGDYYDELPEIIKKLNDEVEKFSPPFKLVIRLQYRDRRPMRVKAAVIGITQQVFSQRLGFIHEQLSFVMYGD